MLRLWRVAKRLFRFWGQRRPDMAEGCEEKLHGESLLFYVWIWNTRASHRLRLLKLIEERGAGLNVIHLSTRAQVTAFQKEVTGRANDTKPDPPCDSADMTR